MNIASLLLTFLMLWWIVFFMALPIGVKPEDAPVKGQASSAPKNPNLWQKAFITTLITALLMGVIVYLDKNNIINTQFITGQSLH
jgi:predicted secreted protein